MSTYSVFLCNLPLRYVLILVLLEKMGLTQNIFYLLFAAGVNKVIPGICHLNKALNLVNNLIKNEQLSRHHICLVIYLQCHCIWISSL